MMRWSGYELNRCVHVSVCTRAETLLLIHFAIRLSWLLCAGCYFVNTDILMALCTLGIFSVFLCTVICAVYMRALLILIVLRCVCVFFPYLLLLLLLSVFLFIVLSIHFNIRSHHQNSVQSLLSKYCSYTCNGINAVHFIVFFICSFVFIEKSISISGKINSHPFFFTIHFPAYIHIIHTQPKYISLVGALCVFFFCLLLLLRIRTWNEIYRCHIKLTMKC